MATDPNVTNMFSTSNLMIYKMAISKLTIWPPEKIFTRKTDFSIFEPPKVTEIVVGHQSGQWPTCSSWQDKTFISSITALILYRLAATLVEWSELIENFGYWKNFSQGGSN